MEKLRIIVGGFLGILPAGGITWDYIQYPLGLSYMGHDVYYIEDTQLYPIYQKPGKDWNDCSDTVAHLQAVMTNFGLSEKWAYRDVASGKSYGLNEKQISELCKTADVFINVSCSSVMREEYAQIPVRILLDSDPMFTQIQYMTDQSFTQGEGKLKELVQQHNFYFTFGENIGSADCLIPEGGIQWRSTRQPVCLKHWPMAPLPDSNSAPLTTLMNWASGKKLIYQNQEWGQKDAEFHKIMPIPCLFPDLRFCLAINQTERTNTISPYEEMRRNRWNLESPDDVAGNWADYQGFIESSFAEFSVAKHTYVKAFTGWFSCRSACYLASGRPVITQETGWSKYIPSGKGALTFSNQDEAAEAIRIVLKDPGAHARAAREIAEDYFDSDKVLRSMLNQLN
jgi:hypothetical protein